MPNVLVIGASGRLGQYLLAEAKVRGQLALGTDMEEQPVAGLVRLNLSDLYETVKLLRDGRPAMVLLAATMTSVDGCEGHPEQAALVNADDPREIAKACATLRIRLAFFSTDYVFDGRKDGYTERASPKPINVYGRTKLDGERAVLAAHPGALVLRTSANFGWNRLRAKENSVTWILGRLRRGEKVPLFTDQRVTPSYVPEVARLTLDLLDRGANGIFHMATRPALTRYAMGEAVCEVFGLPKRLLEGSRLADAKLLAMWAARRVLPAATYVASSRRIEAIEGILRDRPGTALTLFRGAWHRTKFMATSSVEAYVRRETLPALALSLGTPTPEPTAVALYPTDGDEFEGLERVDGMPLVAVAQNVVDLMAIGGQGPRVALQLAKVAGLWEA